VIFAIPSFYRIIFLIVIIDHKDHRSDNFCTFVVMKYIEYVVSGIPDEEASEIVVAELADLGFDSFSDYLSEKKALRAYVTPEGEAETRERIDRWLEEAGYGYDRSEMADEVNWNALWESHFEPVEVGERCCVRAPFHTSQGAEYEIVIMPKMSFGTGHHATTWLMLDAMLDRDLKDKTGLDMGSGTGVLAILAAMKGARAVDAIDIDSRACRNCLENIFTNDVQERVAVREGDASLLDGIEKYDFILANINRNILLHDMPRLAGVLKPDGIVFFSGFLEIDVPMIRARAESLGLACERVKLREGWAMTACRKR
jgi:ribosomal protein L11 methyltransferase